MPTTWDRRRIEKLMRTMGLSRGQLANLLGVHYATVDRWMNRNADAKPGGLASVALDLLEEQATAKGEDV